MKQCCKCKLNKSEGEFYKNPRTKDGLNTFCIECHKADNVKRKLKNRADPKFKTAENEYKKAYRERTVEQRKEYMRSWRGLNPTRANDYYVANLEHIKEYAKRYRIDNTHKINAKTRRRQAAKLQRTPQWLTEDDFWLMKEIYDLAQLRTKIHGFAWHVDHIVPLQGKIVSGLHVTVNLRVIPAQDNYTKNNRFEVENGIK